MELFPFSIYLFIVPLLNTGDFFKTYKVDHKSLKIPKLSTGGNECLEKQNWQVN